MESCFTEGLRLLSLENFQNDICSYRQPSYGFCVPYYVLDLSTHTYKNKSHRFDPEKQTNSLSSIESLRWTR